MWETCCQKETFNGTRIGGCFDRVLRISNGVTLDRPGRRGWWSNLAEPLSLDSGRCCLLSSEPVLTRSMAMCLRQSHWHARRVAQDLPLWRPSHEPLKTIRFGRNILFQEAISHGPFCCTEKPSKIDVWWEQGACCAHHPPLGVRFGKRVFSSQTSQAQWFGLILTPQVPEEPGMFFRVRNSGWVTL